MLPGEFHERQMALMQITHSRYKRNAQLASQLVTQLFNRMYNLQYILRMQYDERSNRSAGVSQSNIDGRIGLGLCDFEQRFARKFEQCKKMHDHDGDSRPL